jgi:hypothetical protein
MASVFAVIGALLLIVLITIAVLAVRRRRTLTTPDLGGGNVEFGVEDVFSVPSHDLFATMDLAFTCENPSTETQVVASTALFNLDGVDCFVTREGEQAGFF